MISFLLTTLRSLPVPALPSNYHKELQELSLCLHLPERLDTSRPRSSSSISQEGSSPGVLWDGDLRWHHPSGEPPPIAWSHLPSFPLPPPAPLPFPVAVQSLSRVWLCNPTDCSPPGSSVHRISQARKLGWVAFPPPVDHLNPGIKLTSDGNPLQYCYMGNPRDRGIWKATIHGVTRVRCDLVTKPPPQWIIKCLYILL